MQREQSLSEARHLRIYIVTESMLLVLLHEGATARCMSGLPWDARLMGVNADFARNSIMTCWEHPSFDPVEEGIEPPIHRTSFEIIDDTGAAHRGRRFSELSYESNAGGSGRIDSGRFA